MSMTFLFWLSALYTVALFGAQAAELLTAGHFTLNISTANAFYLALLSAYVGSKEIRRWTGGDVSVAPASPPPFRLSGEWFVGLWAVFLLLATFLSQLWPARFAYPQGLTVIAFEVLGFYAGSSASRWLSEFREQDRQDHAELEKELEAPAEVPAAPAAPPGPARAAPARTQRKRQAYEKKIIEAARQSGGVSREQAEKLLGLSRAAVLRLIGDMVARKILKPTAEVGDPGNRYQAC
jgi:hypothetical protein